MTNSSNQGTQKYHSSHKPNNSTPFSNAKQSNNNTSKKVDNSGSKNDEQSERKKVDTDEKNARQMSEGGDEGSSVRISRTESSPKPRLNSPMDNDDTLRRKNQKPGGSIGSGSAINLDSARESRLRRATFSDKTAEKQLKLEQKYRTAEAGQKPHSDDDPLGLEKESPEPT